MALQKKTKVESLTSLAPASMVAQGFTEIHYCDRFVATLENRDLPLIDSVVVQLFSLPGWVTSLLRLRDFLVKPFGLATGKNETAHESPTPNVEKAFFAIIARDTNEIVMGEQDKHLDFRLSVYLTRDEGNVYLHLTTIVHFNNIWGKLYFIPVKPFHKIIVRSLCNRVVKAVRDNNG